MSRTSVYSAVWSYIEIGDDLLRAAIRNDGAVINYVSRSVIDDVPADARWMTYRSVTACAARVGVPTDLSTMALVGPNGGLTALAREITRQAESNGRDGQIYTTAEIISKFVDDEEKAAALLEAHTAFYAVEAEVAA